MSPLTARILEQKRQRRQALAALPFPEKVRIVEKLREASLQIASVARQQGLSKPEPPHPRPPVNTPNDTLRVPAESASRPADFPL